LIVLRLSAPPSKTRFSKNPFQEKMKKYLACFQQLSSKPTRVPLARLLASNQEDIHGGPAMECGAVFFWNNDVNQ
jgi:hypothetical protein